MAASMKDREALIERAKSKKDGIFSWYGTPFRVSKGCLTHYYDGEGIVEVFGTFNVTLTICKRGEAAKLMRSLS